MTQTQTARQQLAAALRAELPDGWSVLDLDKVPDVITRPTVVIYRQSYAPLPAAPVGHYEQTFAVWVLVAPDAKDSLLDDHADTVTGALEDIDWTVWTTASRDALAGTWPGFNITVTAQTKKEYDA
ncbi:hypothetical protein [Cellulomonas sp. NPDC089187]|uniref:hypothetical protein n=1 Tax=Cellulomonas sp. NPDC089187 TaxID=3154970 RepID=UPI00341B155B